MYNRQIVVFRIITTNYDGDDDDDDDADDDDDDDDEHVGELDGWHLLVGQPSGHLELHHQQEEPEYIALTLSMSSKAMFFSDNDILLQNCPGCAIRASQITLADT